MNILLSNSTQLPGCHHCIGAAHTSTDVIFRIIKSRAISNGGMISVEEIANAHAQFNESISSSVDSLETIHQECMEASGSYAPDRFSRDRILSTLLSACGQRSSRHVFKVQIEKCGPEWLDYFFYALSKVARDNLSKETKVKLLVAYVDAAIKFKSNLSVPALLNQTRIREIVLECIVPFSKRIELDEVSKSTSDRINKYIATKYNFTGPYITKITADQMKQYFATLQKETESALRVV